MTNGIAMLAGEIILPEQLLYLPEEPSLAHVIDTLRSLKLRDGNVLDFAGGRVYVANTLFYDYHLLDVNYRTQGAVRAGFRTEKDCEVLSHRSKALFMVKAGVNHSTDVASIADHLHETYGGTLVVPLKARQLYYSKNS